MTYVMRSKIEAKQLNQVLAILFYGRSGSFFLQSLLDGHPNLIALPPYLPQTYYEFWRAYGHLTASKLIDEFADYYATLFDARNPCKSPIPGGPNTGENCGLVSMGPEQNEVLGVDRGKFMDSLKNIIGPEKTISRKFFYQAIHVAYTEALERPGVDPHPIMMVQLHAPHPERMREILEDFPETKFLQAIRQPLQTLGSIFESYYKDDPKESGLTMKGILLEADLSFVKPECFRAVRLEDLHQASRETLQKICRWLGIPWDDVLLKSTFDGKQWWNVKGGPRISGFSNKTMAKQHGSYITGFDRFRFNILLAEKYRIWNYSYAPWHLNIVTRIFVLPLLFIPFKMELLSMESMNSKDRIWQTLRARKILIAAWLKLFQRQRLEPQLLG